MNNALAFAISLISYLMVTGHLLQRLRSGKRINRQVSLILLSVGAIFHAITLYPSLLTQAGLSFSLVNVLSLTSLLMLIFSLMFSSYRPIIVLHIFSAPLAALGLLIGYVFHPKVADVALHPLINKDFPQYALQLHIILSIAAYSVLFMAAMQAILLHLQTRELKHQSIYRVWVKLLPSLQTMEKLLFDMILLGFCLLSVALLFGWFGVTDLLAQHLAHKTFFSGFAWLLFAYFLYGHWKYGWRGKRAANMTLWGFSLLAIGFIGTKAILEIFIRV